MQQLGKLIHTLDIKLKRKIDNLAAEYDLTAVQFIVMESIYLLSRDDDVFQRDLETALDVRRSTISNVLGLLENKGYVTRQSVSSDARLKKLLLTDAGQNIYKEFKIFLKKAEAEDFRFFSEKEAELLIGLLNRLCETIK